MNKILNNAEKNNLIGAAKSPAYKKGGALSAAYPTKKEGCGCSKK
jgi:hypothetical protein